MNKNVFSLFITALMVIFCNVLQAQGHIVGHVWTPDQGVFKGALITLLNAEDSTYVCSTTSVEDGEFTLTVPNISDKKEYLLSITANGYWERQIYIDTDFVRSIVLAYKLEHFPNIPLSIKLVPLGQPFPDEEENKGHLAGIIIDTYSEKKLNGAKVTLFKEEDSSYVCSVTSDENGEFGLSIPLFDPKDRHRYLILHYLHIEAEGYKTFNIRVDCSMILESQSSLPPHPTTFRMTPNKNETPEKTIR